MPPGGRSSRGSTIEINFFCRFALRHSNQESEVSNSMKTLADFVCEECINLDVYVQNHWTGSLIELCVDTLLRAAHAESNQFSRVLLKVCQRLLDEVVQENKPAMVGMFVLLKEKIPFVVHYLKAVPLAIFQTIVLPTPSILAPISLLSGRCWEHGVPRMARVEHK